MLITKNVEIDINNLTIFTPITATQGDKDTRFIEIKPLLRGQEIDLSNCTATANATNKNIILAEDVDCDVTENSVLIPVTEDMLIAYGDLVIELTIFSGVDKLVIPNIKVRVNRSNINEDTTYAPEKTTIGQVIYEVEQARGDYPTLAERINAISGADTYTREQIDTKIQTVENNIPTKTSQLENDDNFIKDVNYVHTDNNFTTEYINDITGLKQDIEDVSTELENLNIGKLDVPETEGTENQVLTLNSDLAPEWKDVVAKGEVIELGSYQYSYKGVVLPAIPVEKLRTVYEKDKNGTPLVLRWTLYGTENNLKIVSSDLIAGTYSIDVLVHNKYHCAYEWKDDTTGNVNPKVQESEYDDSEIKAQISQLSDVVTDIQAELVGVNELANNLYDLTNEIGEVIGNDEY